MAGMCTAFGTGVSSVHDPGYVQMWRKQREEAIARGEDPGVWIPNQSMYIATHTVYAR